MLSTFSSTLGRSILRPLAVRATPRFLAAAAPSQRWFSEVVAAAAAQAAVSGDGNLTLKPAGVQHIIDVSKKRNIPTALRLTVDSGGCGGFQYYFDLVPAGSATATDTKVEADDGSVVMLVDALVVQGRVELYAAVSALRLGPFSESYLDHCKVDFVEEMIGSKFVVVYSASGPRSPLLLPPASSQVSENKLAESACSCGASFNVGF